MPSSEFRHNYPSRFLAKMIRYPHPTSLPFFLPRISAIPTTRTDWGMWGTYRPFPPWLCYCWSTARSTQPCIPPGSLNRVPASAGGKGGTVTSAGWQVTLCDPMWHVSSRSGVATLRTAIHLLHTLLTYFYGTAQVSPRGYIFYHRISMLEGAGIISALCQLSYARG